MTDSPIRLLLEFDNQAQRDRSQPPAFLHRRDRKFALVCEEQGVTPDAARWLAHVNRLSGRRTKPASADQTLTSWRRITAGFAMVGIIAGVLTMAGLLFYDGGQRINITVFMAFVALHLTLALITTLQALAGWQPWRWLARRLEMTPGPDVFNNLQPVLMARAAHLGGITFGISGLLTLLTMVVLQDLAFGWSTTLETAATSYHGLVAAIATPWAWLWPAAAPDLALVEATRFFRAGDPTTASDPALWGQWWPFVAMLWVTWVLLPRVLLWVLASVQIRTKARRLLTSHPAMHALLYRMETPALDTGNSHHDADDLPDTDTRGNLLPLPDSDILLCWAGAGAPELPEGLRSDKQLVLQAGGNASLSDDDQTLHRIAEHLKNRARPVILLVRCWQPPTGELQDTLETARDIWPRGSRIALVPLAADSNQLPDVHQIQPWLRFAERVGREFLQVSLPPLPLRDSQEAIGEPS